MKHLYITIATVFMLLTFSGCKETITYFEIEKEITGEILKSQETVRHGRIGTYSSADFDFEIHSIKVKEYKGKAYDGTAEYIGTLNLLNGDHGQSHDFEATMSFSTAVSTRDSKVYIDDASVNKIELTKTPKMIAQELTSNLGPDGLMKVLASALENSAKGIDLLSVKVPSSKRDNFIVVKKPAELGISYEIKKK